MKLDSVDEKILSMLRENARMPYVEMAGRLGLSEAAVRRRVKKLVSSGVIKRFTIETEVSKNARAITLVSVESDKPTSSVATDIKNVPGVKQVYEITGQYDIAVFIEGDSIADVNSTIDKIRGMGGIAGTNTVIVLREV